MYVILCINIDIQHIQNFTKFIDKQIIKCIFCYLQNCLYVTDLVVVLHEQKDQWAPLTHSLTAALDQLRVVVSSTIYGRGSQAERLQQISQCLPLFVGFSMDASSLQQGEFQLDVS